MENHQSRKIYSKNQIDIATFIGGPLIAGYLISQNFKVFGDKEASKKTMVISLISTAIFIGLLILLRSITNKIPSISIAIIPLVVASLIVRTYQSEKIEEYLKKGYSKASSLEVFGKSILSLLIAVMLFFLLAPIKTFVDVKYNYGNYLMNYCNSLYNEKNIPKDKNYVPEDASCFVFKYLENKGYTLQQVDKVLTLEFEYQKEIGLVSESNQAVSNNSVPYDPLPFIRENQTLTLSDEQISEILTIEEDYLKLIGVVEK